MVALRNPSHTHLNLVKYAPRKSLSSSNMLSISKEKKEQTSIYKLLAKGCENNLIYLPHRLSVPVAGHTSQRPRVYENMGTTEYWQQTKRCRLMPTRRVQACCAISSNAQGSLSNFSTQLQLLQRFQGNSSEEIFSFELTTLYHNTIST